MISGYCCSFNDPSLVKINDLDKVYKILKFVVETSNTFGFLAEQVDNNTKDPVWVTGLGWSHAMFILLLDKLTK